MEILEIPHKQAINLAFNALKFWKSNSKQPDCEINELIRIHRQWINDEFQLSISIVGYYSTIHYKNPQLLTLFLLKFG